MLNEGEMPNWFHAEMKLFRNWFHARNENIQKLISTRWNIITENGLLLMVLRMSKINYKLWEMTLRKIIEIIIWSYWPKAVQQKFGQKCHNF